MGTRKRYGISIALLAILAVIAALLVAAPRASAATANQLPCPMLVQVGQNVTLVCDDGAVTFDLAHMVSGETYRPLVKAGSHTVWLVVRVGNEVRVFYDQPRVMSDGQTVWVTILNVVTGEVYTLG